MVCFYSTVHGFIPKSQSDMLVLSKNNMGLYINIPPPTYVRLAQWIRRLPPEQEIPGSSPGLDFSVIHFLFRFFPFCFTLDVFSSTLFSFFFAHPAVPASSQALSFQRSFRFKPA